MTHLVTRLDRGCFEPAVCCLTRGGPLEAQLAEANVPVQILHKRGRWDARTLVRLVRTMRRFQPQIVHTWLPTANTLGRVAALSAHVPAIVAAERAADVWKGFARRLVDRALARRTARIVTNAEGVMRFLVERIGLPAERIRVIRNGLDLAAFDAAASRPPTPLPVRAGALVIGTVGRLEPQKGMTHLLEAFAAGLPTDGRPVQLWIAGSGPEEPALREQARRLGIDQRVRFLGQRDDVPALLGQMDLFVLPSLWEGLPNAALEAMAARRAVVATAVNGTPEAVVDGLTGLLTPPADPTALREAMSALLRDEERRRRFGEAGRQRVETEFTMERMVAQTEVLYHEALEEAGR